MRSDTWLRSNAQRVGRGRHVAGATRIRKLHATAAGDRQVRFGAGSLARPDLSTGLRHANTYNGLMVRSWSLVGCTRGPRACALRRRRSGQRSDIGLV